MMSTSFIWPPSEFAIGLPFQTVLTSSSSGSQVTRSASWQRVTSVQSAGVARHAAMARVTYPVWLYVSITGVVVYWMLYQMSFTTPGVG